MTDFRYRNTKAAKLTLSQVAEIKSLYREGRTQSSLSRIYQVSVGQIGRIVRGESWQGIAAEPTKEEMAASYARFQALLAADAAKAKATTNEVEVLKQEFGEKPPVNPLDEE